MKRAIACTLAFVATAIATSAHADDAPIVPDCSKSDQNPSHQDYQKALCGDTALLSMAKKVSQLGDALLDRLSGPQKSAFATQQQAFPKTPYNCQPDPAELRACLKEALEQRIADLQAFKTTLKTPPPICDASKLKFVDSGLGDAGMSQNSSIMFIEYTGDAACILMGYPATNIFDAKGNPVEGGVVYSGSQKYIDISTPPLPVTLSPSTPQAWFAIGTASACDPLPSALTVKIGPPLEPETVLETTTLSSDACVSVSVSPVAMRSTALSSLN